MKTTILNNLLLSFFIISLNIALYYSWGLRYWVQTEQKNKTKRVKVYSSYADCKLNCETQDCYKITDYHQEAYTALFRLGYNVTNSTENPETQTICYTKNTPIPFSNWVLNDTSYFNNEKAILYNFKYEDICNSFCQPLFGSGCTLTYFGWYCFKSTANTLKVPVNKTKADFNMPEKFQIVHADNCLKFTPGERIEFDSCSNSTDFVFTAEHLNGNSFVIMHENNKEKNGTKYALTYTRNFAVLKFEKVVDKYYKQTWDISHLCEGKYNLHPYKISALCARVDYLRKCDDDEKEIADLHVYEIKGVTG